MSALPSGGEDLCKRNIECKPASTSSPYYGYCCDNGANNITTIGHCTTSYTYMGSGNYSSYPGGYCQFAGYGYPE